jgi:CheY-like chemotaxis protein
MTGNNDVGDRLRHSVVDVPVGKILTLSPQQRLRTSLQLYRARPTKLRSSALNTAGTLTNSFNSDNAIASRVQRRALRIVVADDEPDTVTTLSAILRDEGHEVFPAYKGIEVLRGIRQHKPDALVVDIDMPGMSGYSVAREVRQMFQPSPPLLIAISGKWIGQTDKMLATLAGFDHFLQKPCDPHVLIGLLEPLRRAPPQAGEDTAV